MLFLFKLVLFRYQPVISLIFRPVKKDAKNKRYDNPRDSTSTPRENFGGHRAKGPPLIIFDLHMEPWSIGISSDK